MNRKDRVKILDFALATSAVSEESEIQATLSCAPDLMTRPGTILGTMGIWVIAVVGVAPCKCFSPGGKPEHVAGPDFLHRSAPTLRPSTACRDNDGLTEEMPMPCSPRTRLES